MFSQLVTMKSVQDLISIDEDPIKVNWYRGHSHNIKQLYRNEWCLLSDLVIAELENGEIYIWCVSTAQLERRFMPQEANIFIKDRNLHIYQNGNGNRRPDLPHLTKYEKDVYNLNGSPHLHANVLMVDIRALGNPSLHTEFVMTARHSDAGIINTDNNNNNNNNNNHKNARKIDQSQTQKLSDILSLLIDWGIRGEYEHGFLNEFRSLILDMAPCYGFVGDFESITLLFPVASAQGGRWRIQPKITAAIMLAVNSIAMWLMQCALPQQLPVCSRLVTYYHVMLPELLQLQKIKIYFVFFSNQTHITKQQNKKKTKQKKKRIC